MIRRPKRHRYRNVVAALYGNAWAILPEKLEVIRELIELRSAGYAFTREELSTRLGPTHARRSTTDEPQSQIAVLNLFGVIAQRMNGMEEISGGTSAEMFGKAFDRALADSSVAAIVINVDSPGGTVPGVPELAAKIFAARGTKPIVAIANSLCASAALWIASAADELVATPSAYIGSIGVMYLHTDASAADRKQGYKRTIITTSPHKADGNPYHPLSESAKSDIEGRVNAIHAQFVAAVAQGRGVSSAKVDADFGQGRVLLAADALQAGLVDRIVTFDDLLAEFGSRGSSSPRSVSAALAAPSASSQQSPLTTLKESGMDPKVFAALVAAGIIPADASQAVAQAALNAFFTARAQTPPTDVGALVAAIVTPATPVAPVAPAAAAPAPVAAPVAAPPAAPVPGNAAPVAGMAVEDIMAAVRLSPLSAERQMALSQELVAARATLSTSQILERINKEAAQNHQPAGATVVARVDVDARDKFHAAARDAILVRAFENAGSGESLPKLIWDRRTQAMVEWKPAAGGRNYGLASLSRMAEECLVMGGVPAAHVRSLAQSQIARLILGADPADFGISAEAPMFNSSGMFTNVLFDAQNVILRRSYNETNTTFQAWMKRAESLRDFRDKHVAILGEMSDPRAIPENGEFEETTTTDGKEKYRLTVWGEVFSITWQTIVDDNLSAFTDVPMKQGRAMRRKQNKLAYGVLKDNAALLNDSIALFHASHSNLTTGAGAPSVSTLNTLYQKMSTQQGLNTDSAALNLEPKFIIAGPALRGTILELLGSTANPAASNGNPGIVNIWQNGLTPVIDAELGLAAGGSDVAWHLAADSRDVDTIEYAYLQGLESPAFEQQQSFDRLGRRYRMYQAFAVKAIDFRGLQKHAGA